MPYSDTRVLICTLQAHNSLEFDLKVCKIPISRFYFFSPGCENGFIIENEEASM